MQTMENVLLSYIQNVIELIQPYSQRNCVVVKHCTSKTTVSYIFPTMSMLNKRHDNLTTYSTFEIGLTYFPIHTHSMSAGFFKTRITKYFYVNRKSYFNELCWNMFIWDSVTVKYCRLFENKTGILRKGAVVILLCCCCCCCCCYFFEAQLFHRLYNHGITQAVNIADTTYCICIC